MDAIPESSGQVVSHPALDFRFWVTPDDGAPYEVDLGEFAHGGRREDHSRGRRVLWAGDFTGRPVLAMQLASLYRVSRPPAGRSKSGRAAMRTFFRFLDANAGVGKHDRPPIERQGRCAVQEVEDPFAAAFDAEVG